MAQSHPKITSSGKGCKKRLAVYCNWKVRTSTAKVSLLQQKCLMHKVATGRDPKL